MNQLRSGLPRKLNERQKTDIKQSSNNPFISARKLVVNVTSTSGTKVTPQNYLKYPS